MILEKMTRDQLVEFAKSHCVKMKKTLDNSGLKAGEYYVFSQDRDYVYVSDDDCKTYSFTYKEAMEYLDESN